MEKNSLRDQAGESSDASERWRDERRQLKAEIDHLETAADHKVREATKAWEAERAKLLSEVSRLQRSVGDLLERSNNPKRASMSVREELESKLNAAIQAKDRAIAGFLHEKAAWEEEKSKMSAELQQMRLTTGHSKGPRPRLASDDRARELENRIAALQKEIKEIEGERGAARQQIQKLERQVGVSRLAASAELERVQKLSMDIARQIGDPSVDLSTVIKKNVELAELNAYLKGIQFSLGHGKNPA